MKKEDLFKTRIVPESEPSEEQPIYSLEYKQHFKALVKCYVASCLLVLFILSLVLLFAGIHESSIRLSGNTSSVDYNYTGDLRYSRH